MGTEKTVFKMVGYVVSGLTSQIAQGLIGLPDLQRPFVWKTSKVRDLFDSMYRGYPIGYLLLWESGVTLGAKQIGVDSKDVAPSYLIVDGQQRLTSLYAVMHRIPVLGADGAERTIRIAFRPHDATFQVADATTDKNPAFLKDISTIWADGAWSVINNFIASIKEAEELSSEDEQRIADALSRLANLTGYPLTALVLGSDVPVDQVAEVFVRINSAGKHLNQADFILTLMSVHWNEGRHILEKWCLDQHVAAAGGLNGFMEPEPDQMLRVSIALGFRRARLEDAYTVLRGRNPETGRFDDEVRTQQFGILQHAQERALDANSWVDFRQVLTRAGHRSAKTISSSTALYYTYSLFLIGKHDYKVPAKQLREVMARWFFMATLTGRFTSSPETAFGTDLSALPSPDLGPNAFVAHLDAIAAQRLTNDYWSITLPGELATSASRSPSLYAYLAALTILGAPVLFSSMTCGELLQSPDGKTHRHHLFPRKYLESIGIADLKKVNQIANMTLLEARDNIKISADAPAIYFPKYIDELRAPPVGVPPMPTNQIDQMLRFHALWQGWELATYEEFLDERRNRIAAIIREGYEALLHGVAVDDQPSGWPPSSAFVESLLSQGESESVELKSSLRAATGDKEIPFAVLEKVIARTIAGFLNADGGFLIIGVADDGTPLGLAGDLATFSKPDLDQWQLHLINVIHKHLGAHVSALISISVTTFGADKQDIAVIRCQASSKPVYLKDGSDAEFHIRSGNSTRLLDLIDVTTYIQTHWAAPTLLDQ